MVGAARMSMRKFLQLFFDLMGPNEHIGEAFYHSPSATAEEVLTVFPHVSTSGKD
jgi:hypothetical protein